MLDGIHRATFGKRGDMVIYSIFILGKRNLIDSVMVYMVLTISSGEGKRISLLMVRVN